MDLSCPTRYAPNPVTCKSCGNSIRTQQGEERTKDRKSSSIEIFFFRHSRAPLNKETLFPT